MVTASFSLSLGWRITFFHWKSPQLRNRHGLVQFFLAELLSNQACKFGWENMKQETLPLCDGISCSFPFSGFVACTNCDLCRAKPRLPRVFPSYAWPQQFLHSTLSTSAHQEQRRWHRCSQAALVSIWSVNWSGIPCQAAQISQRVFVLKTYFPWPNLRTNACIQIDIRLTLHVKLPLDKSVEGVVLQKEIEIDIWSLPREHCGHPQSARLQLVIHTLLKKYAKIQGFEASATIHRASRKTITNFHGVVLIQLATHTAKYQTKCQVAGTGDHQPAHSVQRCYSMQSDAQPGS